MSTLPPVPSHIVRATAPLLLGGLWNWCLFGVLLVQLCVYSYNFPEDKRFLKLLDLFYWFASGYGDITHLVSPSLSFFDGPIIESMVALIVQMFYAYRIWVLSNKRSWWFCLLICLCATLTAAAGFTGGIYARIHGRFVSGRNLKIIAITWLVLNTIVDILVTSAMSYHLIRRRREIDDSSSGRAFLRIVRLTIETNLLTTSVVIVSLLMIVIFPNENWYTCPMAILGKLYSNTFLVSLNSRIWIRGATSAQVANRNPAMTSAVIPPTRPSDCRTYVTFMEMEQTPAMFKLKTVGIRKGRP